MQIGAVFFFVRKARVRCEVGKVVTFAKEKLTDSFRPLPIITGLVGDALRIRQELVAENIMLRQQLIVASRKIKQPRLREQERGLLVFLSSIVRHWRQAVFLVAAFDRVAEGADIEVMKVTPCAPRMNSVCERCLRGVRHECLDHVLILGEEHLRSVLREHVGGYFNTARPHQAIGQRVPSRKRTITLDAAGKITAIPVLNGLHHDYRRAA